MSISTLAENKVGRNSANAPEPPPPAQEARRSLSDALTAVAAYVPTEIIAAYTIVLALGADDDDRRHGITAIPFTWFFVMLAITPLFVWLLYAVRSKEQQCDFMSPRLWPWWESISACIAFAVWSAALPNTAFARCGWYNPRLAALALLLVSGLLPLVGALVTQPRKAT